MVTLMTAQQIRVVVLLDSEPQAEQTKKDLVSLKLIRSENVLHVGDAFESTPAGGADTEDLFGDDVFIDLVRETYVAELKNVNLRLNQKVPRVVKRVEMAFEQAQIPFHKSRPANLFLRKMATDPSSVLQPDALKRFERLFDRLSTAVDRLEKNNAQPFR
jgi:hypothetical protein